MVGVEQQAGQEPVVDPDERTAGIVDRVIRRRFACRRFSPTPISRATIEEILSVARWAPSGANTQPGQVYVVSGEVKDTISRRLGQAHESERDQHTSEYTYYATPLPDPYNARRQEFGRIYYGSLGVAQSDVEARAAVTARNYRFFDAPIGLIVTIDRRLATGSWIDLGMFLQNIMIAASARGLDTCPQETFSKYHRILREELSIPEEELVVCGMSVGFAAPDRRQNRGPLPKEPLESFTSFHGF